MSNDEHITQKFFEIKSETKIHKRLQQEIESIRWNRKMMEQDLAELKKWPKDSPTVPPCWALRDPDFQIDDEIET